MSELTVKLYFAYTSPFTYLAMGPAYDLESSYRVKLRFIPYGVNIRQVYGGEVEARDERNRRRLRYLYLDARRLAAERGVIIRPPKKIFSARFAFYGGMCAQDQNLFKPYADRVFERFWKRELEIENPTALAAILTEVGADTTKFDSYISDEETEAKPRLKACFAEAERDQVFGVPTFVINGERFWGYDRLNWVRRKLDELGLRRDSQAGRDTESL
ncbi:MAG TPA: DsbA family protein [Candidatus Binataceae bacterium]|nr:DsbA family protein [Candidatus Binataceae bacterium]